jgi:hypothetical protein
VSHMVFENHVAASDPAIWFSKTIWLALWRGTDEWRAAGNGTGRAAGKAGRAGVQISLGGSTGASSILRRT